MTGRGGRDTLTGMTTTYHLIAMDPDEERPRPVARSNDLSDLKRTAYEDHRATGAEYLIVAGRWPFLVGGIQVTTAATLRRHCERRGRRSRWWQQQGSLRPLRWARYRQADESDAAG